MANKIPKLPLPSLEKTVREYYEWIGPFFKSEAEKKEKWEICKNFLEKEGPVLQSKLEDSANQEKGWLTELWEDMQYFSDNTGLGYVNPVVIEKFQEHKSLTSSAALTLFGIALYFQHMLENKLDPPTYKGKLLCPEQYRYLFNCCRIPGPDKDYTVCYRSLEYNYCVILCRNRFFKIRVFDEKNQVLGVSVI